MASISTQSCTGPSVGCFPLSEQHHGLRYHIDKWHGACNMTRVQKEAGRSTLVSPTPSPPGDAARQPSLRLPNVLITELRSAKCVNPCTRFCLTNTSVVRHRGSFPHEQSNELKQDHSSADWIFTECFLFYFFCSFVSVRLNTRKGHSS